MSSSDHENVGYRKPPREHRFSSENQPRRRKKKVARVQGHNLPENLLCALNEDVSITSNGKPTKAKAGDVLARRLVKQAINGTVSEQAKFATLLRGYGEFDPEKMRHEIEDEYSQALEEEQQRYSVLLGF